MSIKMPYKYVLERSAIEVLDEDVDIDAMETPMETKSTANYWEKVLVIRRS